MSMNGLFRQVSPRALDVLLRQPDLLQEALTWRPAVQDAAPGPLAGLPPAVRAMYARLPPAAQEQFLTTQARMLEKMMASPALAGLKEASGGDAAAAFARMTGARSDEPDELRRAGILPADLGEPLEIEKAWHALHWLLARTVAEPGTGVGQAVLGGREAGDDTGYGPVRAMTAEEVAAVAGALAELSADEVLGRFDAEAMNEVKIYPGWTDNDEDREWVRESYDAVRDYYAAARDRGFGMLLAIV